MSSFLCPIIWETSDDLQGGDCCGWLWSAGVGVFFIVDFSLQYNLWKLEFMQEAGIYNNINFHKTILIWSFSNESGGNLWLIIQLR